MSGARDFARDATAMATARDGASIAYTTVGSGPAVMVVPGALSSAATYGEFARHLGARFTVHVVERRGRGASAPQGDDYGMATEVNDLLAIQAATGASYLVGHSYGGLVALEAARGNRAFSKVAVYEPGVSVGGSIPVDWLPTFERLLGEGRPLDAFVAFSLGAGPAQARRMPRWLMRFLLPRVMGRDALAERLRLLDTTVREHRAVARLDGSVANYREVSASVLLMSGGRSGLAWVDAAMDALCAVLPRHERMVFPRLDHFGMDAGAPAEVARVVGDFLQAKERTA